MGADVNCVRERRSARHERVILAFLATEIEASPVANAAQIGNGGAIQLAANPARRKPTGIDAREDRLESAGQLLLEQGEPLATPQRRMHIHSDRTTALTNPIRASAHLRDVASDNGVDAHFLPQLAQRGFVTFLEWFADGQNMMGQSQCLSLHFDEGRRMRQKIRIRWRERNEATNVITVPPGFIKCQRTILASGPEHRRALHGSGLLYAHQTPTPAGSRSRIKRFSANANPPKRSAE